MSKVRIHVTVSESSPAKLKSVRAKLAQQGVEVESVLETIGIITGTVAESRLEALNPGTGNTFEVDSPVQLPPPDDPLQ